MKLGREDKRALAYRGGKGGDLGSVQALLRKGVNLLIAACSQLASHAVSRGTAFRSTFDTDCLDSTLSGAVAKTGQSPATLLAARRRNFPAQRFGALEEFDAICAVSRSAHARYMTGQNRLADGETNPWTH